MKLGCLIQLDDKYFFQPQNKIVNRTFVNNGGYSITSDGHPEDQGNTLYINGRQTEWDFNIITVSSKTIVNLLREYQGEI